MEEHKKKTKESYDKTADEYSKRNYCFLWPEQLAAFKRLASGKKVLEIGCGAGRDARMLVDSGFEHIGIDISEGMLEKAKERVPETEFRAMDFYELDFPNKSFDAFWASASFLHVPKKDIIEVLSEAKRILKPGGIGFISLKEKTEMDEGMIFQDKCGGIERYFSFYEKEEFEKTLKESRFEILDFSRNAEEEKDGSYTQWLCWIVKKPAIGYMS